MKKVFLIALTTFLCAYSLLAQQVIVTGGGAAGDYLTLSAAFAAINAASHSNQDITVTVNSDLTEVYMSKIENKNWNSLRITSVGNRTIIFNPETTQAYNNVLIELKGAKNVTIDNLTLKGAYFVDENNEAQTNAIIYLGTSNSLLCENITVRECMFYGSNNSVDPRSVYSIAGDGVDGFIIDSNHFINCLNLNNTDVYTTVIGANSAEGTDNIGWKIINNHFYETEAVEFTGATQRGFITFNTNSPSTIEDNFIGGSGPNCTGMLTINSETAGTSTSSDLCPISLVQSPNVAEGDVIYSIVKNNTIANITAHNHTTAIKRFSAENPAGVGVESIASFAGILVSDGNVKVENNTIKDILWKTKGKTRNTNPDPSDPAELHYSLRGISCITNFDTNHYPKIICTNNKVAGLRMEMLEYDYTNDNLPGYISGSQTPIMHMGIEIKTSGQGKATVNGNRVIFGYKNVGTKTDIGDGSTMAGFNFTADKTSTINVYENISVIEEFIYPSTNRIWSASALATHNNGGVINLYNNIAYLQPKDANAFSLPNVTIYGIALVSSYVYDSNTTNVFHNTVYLSNTGDTSTSTNTGVTTAALSMKHFGRGSADIWNNCFINMNTNRSSVLDNSIQWGWDTGEWAKNKTSTDYNTYYSPQSNLFAVINESADEVGGVYSRKPTFDDWKFVNKSILFDKNSQQDFHSRFIDPQFTETPNVDLTDISTLDNLRSQLTPTEFLGGRKTEDPFLTELGLDDNSNQDFATIQVRRRRLLPTMGAINTAFNKYWTGAAGDGRWDTLGNWENGVVPPSTGGAVFVAKEGVSDPATILSLDKNITLHDIYLSTDEDVRIQLNENTLNITGYYGREYETAAISTPKGQIEMNNEKSHVVFAGGNDNYQGYNLALEGARAQHIFPNSFYTSDAATQAIQNLSIANKSEYFVLLHSDLTIENRFESLLIPSEQDAKDAKDKTGPFPYYSSFNYTRLHKGGLNCIWFSPTLTFSGPVTANTSIDYQRIPRHAVFNDSVYNLQINSTKTITEHDYLYIQNNFTIANHTTNEYKFEIAVDKFVKVAGLSTNDSKAGVNGLIIKARNSKSDTRKNATFIFSNGKTNDYGVSVPNQPVLATVEMFSPAEKDASNNYKWQFFTVPVKKTTNIIYNQTDLWGTWIRAWDPQPTNGDPYYGTPYWIYLENSDYLTNQKDYSFVNASKRGRGMSYDLQGYEITMNSPKVIPFKGELTNSDATITLTWSDYNENNLNNPGNVDWSVEQEARNGQFVFGNPYTAGLDASQFEYGTNLDPTAYIYTTGSYSDWSAGGGGKTSGKYLAIPKSSAAIMGDDRYISSMQGFVVRMNSSASTNNDFKVTYNPVEKDKTISGNTVVQRSASIHKDIYSVINLESENYIDRLWLIVQPECKKGYDWGWDGAKFIEGNIAQVFTIEDDETYQVSAMDDIKDTYLGFKPGTSDTEYTLTFQHTNMDSKYNTIVLTDLFKNQSIDITESGSSYTFTASSADVDHKRFIISTEEVLVTTDIDDVSSQEESVYTYVKEGELWIENATSERGTYSLFDLSGKCLLNGIFDALSATKIKSDLETGCYVINLSTAQVKSTKSILLK